MIFGVRIFYFLRFFATCCQFSTMTPCGNANESPINFSHDFLMQHRDDPYTHVFSFPQRTYVTGGTPSDHYFYRDI